jgi:CheY-like chemotaxis protein
MTVARPRVLLISESRITRRVVEMTFADEQVDLVSAVTSQEGLAAWEATPATVVLVDLVMDAPPDGFSVARHVHAHAGDRHVAVLLMAGQNDAVDDTEMAAAGVRDVLRTPLDSLQLIEAVRGAVRVSLGQAPWAPPALPEPVAPPAGVVDTPAPAPAPADVLHEEASAMTTADSTLPHPLRDQDLERVAARVAAIWSGDEDRERRLASLLTDRAEQAAAATAAAAAERVAPAATSEAAERLVRELAPALVAEVARLVVADVSERLVREEIARMRSSAVAR